MKNRKEAIPASAAYMQNTESVYAKIKQLVKGEKMDKDKDDADDHEKDRSKDDE